MLIEKYSPSKTLDSKIVFNIIFRMISLDKQDYVVSNLSFFMQSVNIYKLKKKNGKRKKKLSDSTCLVLHSVSSIKISSNKKRT